MRWSRWIALGAGLGIAAAAFNGRAAQAGWLGCKACSNIAKVSPYASSLPAWESRAATVRAAVQMGARLYPLPERTPLNPVSSRLRFRDGYTVENLFFEASPGFFVSGNLYRPLHRREKVPAVLVTHGHFGSPGYSNPRTAAENQILCARLAQMGAVVFTWDMVGYGEALQLKHNTSNVLQLQLWNSMRAIDFLETLPEVDPARIGVTGASGGATQALYTLAADPRVSAAALVVMISAGFTGGDPCEDGMPVHFIAGSADTNNTEIAATLAPKPLLVVSVSADWTDDFPWQEFPYLQRVYGLFEKGDQVRNVHLDEAHDYGPSKRRAAYEFFSRHFGLQAVPETGSDRLNPEGIGIEPAWSMKAFNWVTRKPKVPMQPLR